MKKVKVLKPFHSPTLGNCNLGDTLSMNDALVSGMVEAGLVEIVTEQKIEVKPQPKTETSVKPKPASKSKPKKNGSAK